MFQYYKELLVQEKQLVYFERISRLIQENKQALILIPEIFLTTQFKNRFKLFFWF